MTPPNDAAIEALRNAVAHAPENIGLATELVRLLVDLLRYDEAETAARRALQSHPHSVPLQLALANIYCRQGKDSHALAIVETLVSKKSPDPRALVMHARLMQRQGDIRGAVATYRDAVDRDGESPAEVARRFLDSLGGTRGR